MVLDIEHVGHEAKFTGESGVGLKNSGFEGIVVKAGEKYNFTLFAKQLSDSPIELSISLQNRKGTVLAAGTVSTASKNWQKYTATLTATASNDTASLVILAKTNGKLAMDMISLFPEKTFKNRTNGLRADLAQMLADVKPGFIRFPGG